MDAKDGKVLPAEVSQERGKGDKICYKFQKGQCDKGKNCPFKQVKDDKARTKSPRRKNARLDCLQEEIKGIRARNSQRKKWPRSHPFTMLRASAIVVTSATTSTRTKAAAATKDPPKRTNSPSPKKDKKGKDSECRTMPD